MAWLVGSEVVCARTQHWCPVRMCVSRGPRHFRAVLPLPQRQENIEFVEGVVGVGGGPGWSSSQTSSSWSPVLPSCSSSLISRSWWFDSSCRSTSRRMAASELSSKSSLCSLCLRVPFFFFFPDFFADSDLAAGGTKDFELCDMICANSSESSFLLMDCARTGIRS